MVEVVASRASRLDPSLAPTSGSERIHALDAIRGVAILGVLVAYTVWSLGNPPSATWSDADHAVARGMDLFVDNKFLTTFACLFGIGVAQQWRRWEAAGRRPMPLHTRRMLFLLSVGLVHAIFLRNGDILAPYALLGFLLPTFRARSTSTLVTAAALLAVGPYVAQWLLRSLGVSLASRPSAPGGNYLAENVTWLVFWYKTNPVLAWPGVLAKMIVGLLIGRALIIERMTERPRLARRTLFVGGTVAIATRLAFDWLPSVWTGAQSMARSISLSALYQVNSLALAAAYAAVIVLMSTSITGTALLSPVRAIGRMAFTNYLLQGLVIVPICLAFGLFDRVSPMRGVWVALALGLVQVAFSTWWLSRHEMGPFERLWRTFTYHTNGLSSPMPVQAQRIGE